MNPLKRIVVTDERVVLITDALIDHAKLIPIAEEPRIGRQVLTK